ncbi:aminotransferase class I/II-fold pyridoxal phosphate-dependent enzyme [Micromonospora sp. NPDC005298]|uniref:aminotransferase class I/II-fold pyridoxal phosphate-dependent enzyme n=1 Tax=Micromonospora sp. NPDC005298 TaxID=3156873 RepID=UPI0033A79151
MSALFTLADYEAEARRRLSPPVWDFIEGGQGDERSLRANREAFDRATLTPRVLTGTAEPDPTTVLLGHRWPAPIAVAPTAFQTMAHPEGELATARAAAARGVPYVVSTMASVPFADIAAVGGPLWLQLYAFADRGVTRHVVAAAEAAGMTALVLTVDTPRMARRLRDLRRSFQLPPGVRAVNLPDDEVTSPLAHSQRAFAPALSWSDVEWLRSVTRLPVLLKGVAAAEDAELAVRHGAAGVIVSNHGGRQFSAAPATLDLLGPVADRVDGAVPVLLDGGVRSGTDVLVALDRGADAVLVGRPVLHGLAVDGEKGVGHVLDLLTEELGEAMLMAGVPRLRRSVDRVHRPVGTVHVADLHGSLRDPVLDTMTFLNEVTSRYPAAVSFGPGRPYEADFDLDNVQRHLTRYLDDRRARGAGETELRREIFQYGDTAGQIRDHVARMLRVDEDVDVSPESIVVTVGAQEAMLLVLRALHADARDVLLVPSPCYVGISGAARILDIPIVPVPEGPDGLTGAAVAAAVREQRAAGRRPRACYVVPDHSNPSGRTIPTAHRQELLDVAAEHGILLLEDSPYRLLGGADPLPSLKSMDRRRTVIQLGSYAKSVFPGARIGYVVADQEVLDDSGRRWPLAAELVKIKSMVTVNTSPLSQAVVAGALLAAGRLSEANRPAAAHYGRMRQVMLDRLAHHFPPAERDVHGVSWTDPGGGFFLVVRLPFLAGEEALTRSARDHGVIWVPLSYFQPEGGDSHHIRLSFSCLSEEGIVEGVDRLARFVAAETGCAKLPGERPTGGPT